MERERAKESERSKGRWEKESEHGKQVDAVVSGGLGNRGGRRYHWEVSSSRVGVQRMLVIVPLAWDMRQGGEGGREGVAVCSGTGDI